MYEAGPDPPGAGDGGGRARVETAGPVSRVTAHLTPETSLVLIEAGEGAGLDGRLAGVTVRDAGEQQPGPPGYPP